MAINYEERKVDQLHHISKELSELNKNLESIAKGLRAITCRMEANRQNEEVRK